MLTEDCGCFGQIWLISFQTAVTTCLVLKSRTPFPTALCPRVLWMNLLQYKFFIKVLSFGLRMSHPFRYPGWNNSDLFQWQALTFGVPLSHFTFFSLFCHCSHVCPWGYNVLIVNAIILLERVLRTLIIMKYDLFLWMEAKCYRATWLRYLYVLQTPPISWNHAKRAWL